MRPRRGASGNRAVMKCAGWLLLLLLTAPALAAEPFELERIVDFSTTAPDGSLFWTFRPPTAGDSDTAVFLATWAGGSQQGIVRERHGEFEVVASAGQATPGGSPGLHFSAFYEREIAADSERVVFLATSLNEGGEPFVGLYEWRAGMLRVVADQLTQVPGAPPGVTFLEPKLPTLGPGGLVFNSPASDPLFDGLYREAAPGALEPFAVRGQPAPNHPEGEIGNPGFADVRSATPVLWDSATLLIDRGNGWEGLLNSATAIPGLPGPIEYPYQAYSPAVGDSGVAVPVALVDGHGYDLYRFHVDGVIENILPFDTIDPLTSQPIGAMDGVVHAAHDRVAIRAGALSSRTLYVFREGAASLTVIAREGAALPDGHVPGLLARGNFAFAGDSLVFMSFANDEWVLYRARFGGGPNSLEIPSLGPLGIATLCLALLVCGLRTLRLPNPPKAPLG